MSKKRTNTCCDLRVKFIIVAFIFFSPALLSLNQGHLQAQCSCKYNMSFERAAGGCFGQNCIGSQGNSCCVPDNVDEFWQTCNAGGVWGCGSADVEPGGNIDFNGVKPTHGSTFMSMTCGPNGEGNTMTLCPGGALKAGTQYCFAIDLISRSFGGGNGNSTLIIYGSMSPCNLTGAQVLWTSPQQGGTWKTENFCFTPTSNWTNITFRVGGNDGIGLDNWVSKDGKFPPQVGSGNITLNANTANVKCSGQSNGTATATVASGGIAPFTYLWSNGQTTPTATGLAAGTYTVTVIDSKGCSAIQTVSITQPAALVVAIPPVSTICTGESVSLSANSSGGTPSYSYSWSNGGNSSSIFVSPSVTTGYTVTVSDAGGCTAAATVNVTVKPGIAAAITGAATICAGELVTLAASGGGTYIWNTGATTSVIAASPTATTSYTVVASNGSCSNTATVTITVLNNIHAAITGNNFICTGSSVTLTASGGTTYLWNTGSTSAFLVISPTSSTSYSVIVSSGACTDVASYSVTVSPLPVPVVSSSTICAGQSASLSVSGGGSYQWSNGDTNATITVAPSLSTAYSVTVSIGTCTATAFTSVTVNPLPIPTASSCTVCAGDNATLTAGGGVSYLWSNGATSSVITIAPSVSAAYSVTVTNVYGCTSGAVSLVTVSRKPDAVVSSSTICAGQTTTLTASGGAGYLWSNGNTTAAIQVFPTATSTYSVVVFSDLCSDTAIASVSINPSPLVSLGGDQTICQGQTGTLNAGNPGSTYLWNTGQTSQQVTVSGSGTYWVVVVAANRCIAKDTVSAILEPKIHLSDSSLCTIAPILLDPGSGTSGYLWSTGSTSQTISIETAGTYWVVTSFGHCISRDTAKITGDGFGGTLFIPNAFTPNGDGLNETFLAKGTDIVSFNMNIFDRWGNLIFTSDNISKGWMGDVSDIRQDVVRNAGINVQEDVYVWRINYTTQCFPSKINKIIGHVSIVK